MFPPQKKQPPPPPPPISHFKNTRSSASLEEWNYLTAPGLCPKWELRNSCLFGGPDFSNPPQTHSLLSHSQHALPICTSCLAPIGVSVHNRIHVHMISLERLAMLAHLFKWHLPRFCNDTENVYHKWKSSLQDCMQSQSYNKTHRNINSGRLGVMGLEVISPASSTFLYFPNIL